MDSQGSVDTDWEISVYLATAESFCLCSFLSSCQSLSQHLCLPLIVCQEVPNSLLEYLHSSKLHSWSLHPSNDFKLCVTISINSAVQSIMLMTFFFANPLQCEKAAVKILRLLLTFDITVTKRDWNYPRICSVTCMALSRGLSRTKYF